MPLSRRDILKLGAGAGAALVVDRLPALAQQAEPVRKPIPSSGERIPVIGLGSSQTFNLTREHPEWAPARDVLRLFHQLGGKVIDTAPSYGRSEVFLGDAVKEFGIGDALFLATKVNVVDAGTAAAVRQMENSLAVFGRKTLDLIQVWNLGGTIRQLSDATLGEHMEALQQFKASGRVRYVGISTSRDPQYDDTAAAMQRYTLDFVQLDYSIGDRIPEQRLLPIARERGIAVLVNRPFTTGNLFGRVAGKPLPPWAAEFDCTSWAQFFLKFVVSNPAVTCAIPATNDPGHLRDNMGAGVGRMPDEATRARMAVYFDGI